MVRAADVVDQARTWIGVPFLHQGRSRSGVDCIGLAVVIARELDLVPHDLDRSDYSRLPADGELQGELEKHCARLPAPTPGALMLIRWNGPPTHVAICAGTTMIHALQSEGRVVEHGFRGKWPSRVVATYALPRVTYE